MPAQVKLRIRQRLDEVCGGSDTLGTGLGCNVADLEAICREVRMDMMLETNEILKRRRKRSVRRHWLRNIGPPSKASADELFKLTVKPA